MKDMFNNELNKGDLVGFASPTGSNSRMRIGIVTDSIKSAIFSMYTYSYQGEIEQVYSTRPGYGVSQWKLVKLNPQEYPVIYNNLFEKAKKYLV